MLLHGKIFTGVSSKPYVEAVAIRGEYIVATGDTKTIQALAGPKTVVMDLHGGTVIPGINDAHHHFSLGPQEIDVDLQTPEPSWQQIKDGIAATLAKNPPKDSLIAVTIGFHVFGDPSIDRDALDKLAPDNPVALETFTGHAAVLNSAGLRFFHIAEDVTDPMGGRYERDAKGRLNGTVREYALLNVERAAADRVPEPAAVEQIRQQLNEEMKYGVTSIQELSMSMAPARAVKVLEAIPTAIRVRVARMPGTTAAGLDKAEGQGVPQHPAKLITVNGLGEWLADGVGVEGTLTPRGEWKVPAKLPFDALMADLPLEFPPAEYPALLRDALRNHEQLILHMSGNRSVATMLDAIDATGGKKVWDGRRICFEHGDGIFPDQFERIRQDGVIVVQNRFISRRFFRPASCRLRKLSL